MSSHFGRLFYYQDASYESLHHAVTMCGKQSAKPVAVFPGSNSGGTTCDGKVIIIQGIPNSCADGVEDLIDCYPDVNYMLVGNGGDECTDWFITDSGWTQDPRGKLLCIHESYRRRGNLCF